MSPRLTPARLDEILALQFTIAWAGEAAGSPPRLGWWKSDLVDAEGGGDLFARLLPKTAAWTSLALVRDAARVVDEAARSTLAGGDAVWTVFHLGFALDEQLADRIAQHRSAGQLPADVLGDRFLVSQPWSKAGFESMLATLGKPRVQVTPAGRKVSAEAASPLEAVTLLAAALLPLPATYPLPFAEVVT